MNFQKNTSPHKRHWQLQISPLKQCRKQYNAVDQTLQVSGENPNTSKAVGVGFLFFLLLKAIPLKDCLLKKQHCCCLPLMKTLLRKVNWALGEALPPEAAESSSGQPGLYFIIKINAKCAQPHSTFSIARNFFHDSHATVSWGSSRTASGHSANIMPLTDSSFSFVPETS